MGKASRRAARERLKQERLRQQQRAKRIKVLTIVCAAAAVVVLIVGGGYVFYSSQGFMRNFLQNDEPAQDPREFAKEYKGLPAQELQDDGSVVMAKEGAKAPVVQVYADFQCPACKQFEDANGEALREMATKGEAIVHYRPVSIFAQQGEPVGTNSLRGAAAARAAADQGKFLQYNDLLFENQPPEGQPGFDESELKEWAKVASLDRGAFDRKLDKESEVVDRFTDYNEELMSKAQGEFGQQELQTMPKGDLMQWGDDNGVDSSFLKGTYVREVLDATDAVSAKEKGQFSTPTIYVNDTKLGQNETFSPDALESAVQDAKDGQVDTEPADTETK